MKKILSTVGVGLLFPFLLHGNSIEGNTDSKNKNDSHKVDESVQSEYADALNQYKVKQYQKAYESFNVLFQKNLEDANVNFYLGRSAFELKKYSEAVLAFERVLFSKPDSSRAKLELARAYFMSRNFQEAKKFFLEVKADTKVPKNVIVSIDKYLQMIDDNTQKHFINGALVIGVNYDNNVANGLPEEYVTLNNKKRDWSHQEILLLNHKYNIDNNLIWKNDFMVFSKTMNNNKNSSLDTKLISYTPAFNKVYDNALSVDYGLFVDALWIDDKSNLRTHGLLTKYTLVHNTELVSNGYLKYQTKRHQLNQTKANDSRYIELGTGFTYKDAQTMMYGMNLIYANEKQFNHTANNTIDKQSLNIKANILHTLTSNFTLSPSISYKYSDYQAIDRSDNEYKLALTGTYSHSSTLLFQVVVDDTRVYSNSNNDEYKKNTFTFNLIKAF